MNDTAWFQSHHDGSGMYVPDPNPNLVVRSMPTVGSLFLQMGRRSKCGEIAGE